MRPPGARRVLAGALLGLVAAGCVPEGSDARLYERDPATARWVRDSLFLDTRPPLLFRLDRQEGTLWVTPIASIGSGGVAALRLSGPAWRRLDAEYLHAGRTLTAFANGAALAEPLRLFRGMWQPGVAPLDSLPCQPVVPRAQAILPATEADRRPPRFATNVPRPAPRGQRLPDATVQQLLGRVGLLVAPTVGLSVRDLARYERRVTQVPSGINDGTTVVVEYNDRSPVPRRSPAYAERPRNFIVVFDRGAFDYRPTWTFATSTLPGDQPAMALLDHLDLDADGTPELLLGLRDAGPTDLFTLVLRFEADAWREKLRHAGNRCDT
jgi:hypothetical protein